MPDYDLQSLDPDGFTLIQREPVRLSNVEFYCDGEPWPVPARRPAKTQYRKCEYCQVHNRVKDVPDDLLRCGACGAPLPLKIAVVEEEQPKFLFGKPLIVLDHAFMETNAAIHSLTLSLAEAADAAHRFGESFLPAPDWP